MWKWIKALNPFESDNYHPWMRDELEAARREGRRVQALLAERSAEVEQLRTGWDMSHKAEEEAAELKAQLAQAEIELAEKAFYVREFAAVSAERDALKAEIAQHVAWQEAMVLDIAHVRAERDAFRAKLQRVNDHNQTITEGYKAEIADLRERAEQAEAERDDLQYENPTIREIRAILGLSRGQSIVQRCRELRERASVPCLEPTDDQVEALARVFRDEHAKVMGTDALSYGLTVFCAYARVAIAHLSKRPEGLPTAKQIKAAHMKYIEGYRKGENDGSMCATDFALHYLATYMRQPVEGE